MVRPRIAPEVLAAYVAKPISRKPRLEMPAPRIDMSRYEKKPAFKPNEQQMAVFDWASEGKGNAFVTAVAGAGKTTTLIEVLRRCEGSVFFGAYNAKIVKEIKDKVAKARLDRQGLFIGTMHSAGNNAWKRSMHGHNSMLDEKGTKNRDIVLKMAEKDPQIAQWEAFICKMIGYGKQLLMGLPQATMQWHEIAEHFGCLELLPDNITPSEMASCWGALAAAYQRSIDLCPYYYDYDDMLFAPLYYNVRFFQNDWVFIDEAQDTNPARREMARRMLKPGGRLIAVGDERQAIYGFTGADADSVARIMRDFRCQELPLTVTYRCPKAVVAYAQQWVSHIQAHESAPEGVVRGVAPGQAIAHPSKGGVLPVSGPKPWFIREGVAKGDAILCRYTKPLIETAFAMVKEGIACRVEGRDIGNGLLKLAQRWKTTKLSTLSDYLARYREKEVAKAKEKGSETKAQSIEDICDTLAIIIGRCQEKGFHRVDDLVQEVQALFADDVENMIVLSTGHKAKGREWPRVFWLQKKGGRQNLKDWEALQEDNIKYVIATRAQAELILVPEGMK